MASTLYVTRSGVPDSTAPDNVMDEYDRITIKGGPVSVTIGLEHGRVASVASALEQVDVHALFAIDREFAPFWCPDCEAAYCAIHYRYWDVYDDGFFDCVRGVCPRGHERMLMD